MKSYFIIQSMKTKCVTIDQICGQPEGTFKKFIQEQEAEWKKIEDERKERIKRARNGTGYEPDSA